MKKNLLNLSIILSFAAASTTAANALTVNLSNVTVEQGSQVTLTPEIDLTTAQEPLTWEWRDCDGNVAGTEPTLTVSPSQLTHYRLTVTDATGSSATAKSVVYVLGDAVTATFEDAHLADSTEITLSTASSWIGSGADDYVNGVDTEWYSGSYMFEVRRYSSTWWYGYGLTNDTASTYSDLTQQWRSAPGGAYEGTNFCVAYPWSFPWGTYEGEMFKIYVTNSETGDSIQGTYVTNTPYANNSIIDGDDFGSVAFKTGDYFTVNAVGYNGTTATDTVRFYLADYTSETEADHYTLTTWQWMDLRDLGTVTSIAFYFESTQYNDYGILTPVYVALDNFNGSRNITEMSQLSCTVGTTSVALADYFTLATTGANVTYTLEITSATDGIELTAADGYLTVTGTTAGASATIIVEAVQAGIRQFVQIPVVITDSETGVAAAVAAEASVAVYPVPVTESFTVATALADYSITLYTAAGEQVYTLAGQNGNVTIDRAGLAPGLYLLRVANAGTTVVKRIIIK